MHFKRAMDSWKPRSRNILEAYARRTIRYIRTQNIRTIYTPYTYTKYAYISRASVCMYIWPMYVSTSECPLCSFL
jgi:hypothetical protein